MNKKSTLNKDLKKFYLLKLHKMARDERKYEILYDEYTTNELLNQNFTFDEVLDLYDQWKESQSKWFNSFIEWILAKNERTTNDTISA